MKLIPISPWCGDCSKISFRSGQTCRLYRWNLPGRIMPSTGWAARYRYWTDKNTILGYIEVNIPVLVIGVQKDYRHQGIGTKLLPRLFELASDHAVSKISLNVAKDN